MGLVLGFHLIITAYGFWLPNDPRGSWSDVIRQWELLRFGEATKTSATRSVAGRQHDGALRLAAKKALRYPPVVFDGQQARAIVRGVTKAVAEGGYVIHALAMMPDHLHVVLAWHPRDIDDIAQHLKAKATMQLTQESMHPLAACMSAKGRVPSPWARNQWCPFLWTVEDMCRAIEYVEQNPIKAGLKPQRWNVVTPYAGIR